MQVAYASVNLGLRLQGVFQKWVVRATRPYRSATRRPERPDAPLFRGELWTDGTPFRPTGRRREQASGRATDPFENPKKPCALAVAMQWNEILTTDEHRWTQIRKGV